MTTVNMLHGDCLTRLRELASDSLDSLVTDPPAGIAFMGKEWDEDKGGREHWIAWLADVMRECYRVLKPGAHGLVWALPRTSHWTATALEVAGFEIRDVVVHLFGTGFPKSLDVSKAIDKAAGAKRAVVGHRKSPYTGTGRNASEAFRDGQVVAQDADGYEVHPITAPATDDARRWQGYGTALKPANEHWILVRKPLGEKTVAANVLKHGTGALNIDGCRIAAPGGLTSGGACKGNSALHMNKDRGIDEARPRSEEHVAGRFPANLVLSHSEGCTLVGTRKVKAIKGGQIVKRGGKYVEGKTSAPATEIIKGDPGYGDENGEETVEAWECEPTCAVRMLDEQSGVLKSGARKAGVRKGLGLYANSNAARPDHLEGDGGPAIEANEGGASRFFATFAQRDKDAPCDANTVAGNSSRPRPPGVSVPKPVATEDAPAGKQSSDATARSTNEMPSGSRPSDENAMQAIPSTARRSSRESPRTTTATCSESPASSAGASSPTSTTTTTRNPSNTDGSAASAISDITPPSWEPGAKDSAARFIYCAKASKSDRGVDNKHPTVKSSALMAYLIRLVTPPGGTVLDPFMGSGSTGVAARREGFGFTGIEREAEYFTTAQSRVEATA